MGEIIKLIVKIVLLVFSTWLEGNCEKRKEKQKALQEVENGIKNKDNSAITAAFARVNRL